MAKKREKCPDCGSVRIKHARTFIICAVCGWRSDGRDSKDITLRDFFAGMAMCGFLARHNQPDVTIAIARASYEQADAMLKAREKK